MSFIVQEIIHITIEKSGKLVGNLYLFKLLMVNLDKIDAFLQEICNNILHKAKKYKY